MDPTISLPVHFTIESAVLVAAGLVLAWALVERRFIAAVAAVLLGVIQGLHAGQFVAADDAPGVVIIRLVALCALAVTLQSEVRKRWFGVGLALLVLGTVWGALVGGGAEDASLGSHLILLAGTIPLFVWTWRATRGSVRLRVLVAFLSVLAVAVVVAGGAVARVASVNSRTEQQSLLARQVSLVARSVVERQASLSGRAADSSPAVTLAIRDGRQATSNLRAQATEWVTVIATDEKHLRSLRGADAPAPPATPELVSMRAVRDAFEGQPGAEATVRGGGLLLIGAAPVYTAGSAQTRDDILGAVVVGTLRGVDELDSLVDDDDVEMVLIEGGVSIASEGIDLADFEVDRGAPTIEGDGTTWFASGTRLPGGAVDLVLLAPTSVIVGPALDLVRAFLLAILAAAMLAVVAALWLSSRITRPLLDLADEAERVKTDFLASVSHELRTPLTPIRGYTEILKMTGAEGEASEYLDEIGIATQRLERIVALLVDVAAIEAGRYLIDPQEMAVLDLFGDAATRWAGGMRRHELQVKAARALPPVRGDAAALGRVLDELIDNAVKFSPDGPVELRAKRTGSVVEISVSDKGPGMDEAQLSQARSAFATKESGDTRKFGGLGLGLAFVEGVLHEHGARLDIVSAPGKGTTCSFSLSVAGSVTGMPRKASSRKA